MNARPRPNPGPALRSQPSPPSTGAACAVLMGQSWRAARRNHLWQLLLVASFVLLLGSGVLADFDFGTEPVVFLLDFGFGLTLLLSSLLAVLLPTQQWYDALEGRTAIPTLVRPIARSAMLLGYFGGAWLAMAVFLTVLWGVLGAAAAGAASSSGEVVWPILSQGWLQLVRVTVVLSIFFFFGSYLRSRLLAASGALAWVFAGQLVATAESWIAVTGSGAWSAWVLWMVPDLSVFSLAPGAGLVDGIPFAGMLWATLYGGLYGALYLGAACWCWERREW